MRLVAIFGIFLGLCCLAALREKFARRKISDIEVVPRYEEIPDYEARTIVRRRISDEDFDERGFG